MVRYGGPVRYRAYLSKTAAERPPNRRCKANWARLIQKVYEVDPLECPNCGTAMRMIALIDEPVVIERILKHLKASEADIQPGRLNQELKVCFRLRVISKKKPGAKPGSIYFSACPA